MELMELVNVANVADLASDDKCPFCKKEPIGHATDKPEEVDDKVTSVPADLKCTINRRTDGDLPYTTAQHHLISAIQCYARIRRLVRMGNMVGYDINNPTNGIGLPTTHWRLKYPQRGKREKYGDLDDPAGKKKVADALMKELGAQWHVGHHAFKVLVARKDVDSWNEDGTQEKGKGDYPHETSYDVLIISMLFSLLKRLSEELCDDDEKNDVFKKEMDKISDEIREKLDKFNCKNGAKAADSSPFFVSMRAYEFSRIAESLPSPDIPVNSTSR